MSWTAPKYADPTTTAVPAPHEFMLDDRVFTFSGSSIISARKALELAGKHFERDDAVYAISDGRPTLHTIISSGDVVYSAEYLNSI